MDSASTGNASALEALSNDLANAVESAARSVVAVHGRQRIPSTGIVWREGVIVTAAHTVKRDEDLSVSLPDGSVSAATLAGRDAGTDLAVLRVEGLELPAAEIGDAGSLRVGQLGLAIGYHAHKAPSACLGVVSGLGGAWRTWRGGQIDRLVRIDVALYPGFSGGPLVDASGRVVGVNTSGLTRNAGVAIPASTVERVVNELLDRGRVARGFLGVGMLPVQLPEALAHSLGLTQESGVIVLGVEPNGPAEQGGVILGDVLLALDGAPVGDTEGVRAMLGGERVGQPLRATVLRAGALIELTLTVGEWPRGGR